MVLVRSKVLHVVLNHDRVALSQRTVLPCDGMHHFACYPCQPHIVEVALDEIVLSPAHDHGLVGFEDRRLVWVVHGAEIHHTVDEYIP